LKDELEILQLLGQIGALLEQHRVWSWATHFTALETDLEKAITSGEDWKKQGVWYDLDDLFGGMGSFNDLVITSQSDPLPPMQELVKANDELNKLRRQLYRALRKAHQKQDSESGCSSRPPGQSG
jgi:hypothetical protein